MLSLGAQYALDVILVLDEQGRLLDANRRFSEVYGYAPEEIDGLDLSRLRSKASLTALQDDLKVLASQGHLNVEVEHLRKDGTTFPAELSCQMAELGGKRCMISVIRDITVRKEMERRLDKLRELNRAMWTAHHALLHSTTAEEIFARICAVATRYGLKMAWVGMADGDVVRPACWAGDGSAYLAGIEISLNRDDPHSLGPVGQAILLGRHVIFNDFDSNPATQPWHERSQTYGWRAGASFPLFRMGKVVGALTLYADANDYFGKEETDLLDDLAADISFTLELLDTQAKKAELEAALQKSLDQLVAANLDLERFSEIYWHDLQEPVRYVVSMAQLLERHLHGKLDGHAAELLSMLISSAKRIGQLNRDLQAYSQTRRFQPPPGEIDSQEVVRYVCDELRPVIEQAKAKVAFGDLPTVWASQAELREVFMALLSNALKFAAPDRPLEITITAEAEEDGWRFTVTDNGIGIEDAYLEKIFGLFVRLNGSAVYPGSGVGLAICRKIVERLGGRIWATSLFGQGTDVHFWLRARQMQTVAAQ